MLSPFAREEGGEKEESGPPPRPSSEQASSPLAKSDGGSSKAASLEVAALSPCLLSAALSLSLATPHCSETENSSCPSSSPSSGCVAATWRREAEKSGEEEERDASGTESFSDEKASSTTYSLFPPFSRKHQGTAEFSSAGIQQQPAEAQLGWSEAPPGHCSRGPAGLQSGKEEEEDWAKEVEEKKTRTRRKKRPGIEIEIDLFVSTVFEGRFPLVSIYKRMICSRDRSREWNGAAEKG